MRNISYRKRRVGVAIVVAKSCSDLLPDALLESMGDSVAVDLERHLSSLSCSTDDQRVSCEDNYERASPPLILSYRSLAA